MNERDRFPNLDPEVTIHHCNASNVMPIEIADKVIELKQLWIHDDVEETEASQIMDGSSAQYHCPHCKHTYWVYLGD